MTFDTEPAIASPARTTAAGLEAWLAGAHPEPDTLDMELPVAAIPEAEPLAESAAVGPVNAAEALAWSLAQGTFSSARKLTGPDGAELVVDPENNAYHFESTALKPLAVVLQQPASAWTPVYSEALKLARASHPAQSLERLRWYAGLIATPGILGRMLNRSQRYKLSRWPETEREYPKHFRIAKEMLKEAATVDAIVAGSGMSHEDVVDYVNASFAAGRIETASVAKPAEEAPAPSRGKRLIAALNKPLFAR